MCIRDRDKNEKYVAKSVCSGRVSTSKMCGKVSHLCGVHRKVVGAPMGDPIEINVRGYELSIRKSEAQNIRVEVSE